MTKDMDPPLDLYIKTILGKKALNVVAIDVAEMTSYADVFIFCSGRSNRQVNAIAEHIQSELKKHKIKPLSVEGTKEGHWVLLDYGHVIIHVFYEPIREFYDLEGLWVDAKRIMTPSLKKQHDAQVSSQRSETLKPYTTITDFVSGREIPNIGAEENRQMVARYLVDQKGYAKDEIEVDVKIEMAINGEPYQSQVDLVVGIDDGDLRIMAIKCAAGSLGSREREILAAARLLYDYQIPFAVVSDGMTATVLDTVSGKKIGEGLDAIPSKDAGIRMLKSYQPVRLPTARLAREKLIFRTYDSDNVNVQRNI